MFLGTRRITTPLSVPATGRFGAGVLVIEYRGVAVLKPVRATAHVVCILPLACWYYILLDLHMVLPLSSQLVTNRMRFAVKQPL